MPAARYSSSTSLIQSPPSFAARHSPSRAVIDRVAAPHGAGIRPQDVAPVLVRAGYQHRVTVVLPDRSGERRVTRRKRAGRALAMHPDLAELRMRFLLDEVVTDLVDELEVASNTFRNASAICSKMTSRLRIAKFPPAATAFK